MQPEATEPGAAGRDRGKTVHGEPANAGHRVLAPDDAEVEAYLETALHAPAPDRTADDDLPPTEALEPDRVVVLDFGSQFAQLIARRVRELNVYSRAAAARHAVGGDRAPRRRRPSSCRAARTRSTTTARPSPTRRSGTGASRCSASATAPSSWPTSSAATSLPTGTREYGPATVTITADDGLFDGLDREQPVWMSHGDSITRLPEGFRPTAQTDSTPFAGLRRPGARPVRRSSSTPRSSTRPRGRDVLRNFVLGIAGARPDLDRRELHRLDRRRDPRPRRRPRRGDRLGRQGHLRAVRRRRLGGRGGARPSGGRRPADLHLRGPRADAQAGVGAAARDVRGEPGHATSSWSTRASASSRRLAGVEDPEQKRRIIGDEFIRVFEEEADEARPDRLPDPGHALPGRHRVAPRPRRRPPRRSRPTTTSAGCRPTCASSSSSRCATCSRTRSGAVGMELGLPEAMVHAPAVPGARPRDPDHRRGHRRAARHAARRRLDRDRRDQGRRPLPQRSGSRSRS